MLFQELVFSYTTISLMLITIVFTVRYSFLLRKAQNEYENAKMAIKGIVFTFKKKQEQQQEVVNKILSQFEITQAIVEITRKKVHDIENNVINYIKRENMTSITPIVKTEEVESVKREINIIIENQNRVQGKLDYLEDLVKKLEKDKKIVETANQNEPMSKLTDTEIEILKYLTKEGPKTAPELETKIKKTREHTSRLMKKLWQQGYVERETHRIPFIYRTAERFKTRRIQI